MSIKKAKMYTLVHCVFFRFARNYINHVESVDDFDNQLKNARNQLLLVAFTNTSSTSVPSLANRYLLNVIATDNEAYVMEVDFNKHKEWATKRYGVETEPTFIFLYNGHEVERYRGRAISKFQIKASVKRLNSGMYIRLK